jgi:hypothetical protein
MIFIENKYTVIYYKIIERSKNRNLEGYTEKHHIIPKSLGGTNDKTNLAILTAKEHYICHILLTKMTFGENKIKMLHAVNSFISWASNKHKRNFKFNSRLFQILKEKRSHFLKIEMSKPENKKKSSDGAKKLWADINYKKEQSSKRKELWKDVNYQNKMKNRKKTTKRICVNNVEFLSLKDAAYHLNLDPSTVSKRCSSHHIRFAEWKYIRD